MHISQKIIYTFFHNVLLRIHIIISTKYLLKFYIYSIMADNQTYEEYSDFNKIPFIHGCRTETNDNTILRDFQVYVKKSLCHRLSKLQSAK